MSKDYITLKGCRENNLKDITVDIPKNRLVVITGVCGSGKSSLAFDTLFSEGQRRYLECLSPRIRMAINHLPHPDIESATGLSPSIAVEQHRSMLTARHSVATATDIYAFLSLLFAAFGVQHSPSTGKPLYKHTPQEMVDIILSRHITGSRLQLIAPVFPHNETVPEAALRLQKMGFMRIRIGGKEIETTIPAEGSLDVIVDRIVIKEGIKERLYGSLLTALSLSSGIVMIQEGVDGATNLLSEEYYCPESGEYFPALSKQDFNYNSPRGMCPACKGEGTVDHTICPECAGTRIKNQSRHCLIDGENIAALCSHDISSLLTKITSWKLSDNAADIIAEIQSRLTFLDTVGLGYLSLDRCGDTLSVGEAMRVQLAAHIAAKLSGITYILDEPSRGLHKENVASLITIATALRDSGNTVIVVEHDKEFIAAADHIIELGPGAGTHGGTITFHGSYSELCATETTPTGAWLGGFNALQKPRRRSQTKEHLSIRGASCHTITDMAVDIPLKLLVGFCGVSGSGKSTLLIDIIASQLHTLFSKKREKPLTLSGYESLSRLIVAGQDAAGISTTSTPATYIDIMPTIRTLIAQTKLAKARGYSPSWFSLTKKGGRCEACKGSGSTHIAIEVMADIVTPCGICGGKRFSFETLQVTWNGHSIADILDMPVSKAALLFKNITPLRKKLTLLTDLGLGYLSLGQHFSTLSGGEMQRIKLIKELSKESLAPTLYILDEPSSGLHFDDIDKLISVIHRLVDNGHSVFMIEHNIDMLKQCDHLIELGPCGGLGGGRIIFQAPPATISQHDTPTARFF